MKIFKMIIIFMLCFLLVGCGEKELTYEEKLNQVIEVYTDTGDHEKAISEIGLLYEGEFTDDDADEQIRLINGLTTHIKGLIKP